ncbi:MAG: methyltransferase domain-containing protein, partial [Longimicrobiales bacterium]
FNTGRRAAGVLGYQDAWLDPIPEAALESFAGTGNPFSIGALTEGDHVVDVGAGSGLDSLIAGTMVGPNGHVIGVDMTDAMLGKARSASTQMGLDHVEFRRGYIERLPVPDGWADTVISNGVINLSPDKSLVLQEIHRVLRPGGRMYIGDILVEQEVPDDARGNIDLWTS